MCTAQLVHLVWMLGFMAGRRAQNGELRDYCWPGGFNSSCPENHVILVQRARYGRMDKPSSSCLSTNVHVGCYADVLVEVDQRCSGRRHCVIDIPDTQLHDLQPCPKDLLTYLEASYTCVRAHLPQSYPCSAGSNQVLAGPSGFLSNTMPEGAFPSDQGPSRCTWIIQVAQGQRVNLTLFDFGVIQHRTSVDGSMCLVYAVVRERGMSNNEVTVCRGAHRLRDVFLSEHNQLEVQVITDTPRKDHSYFLLRYDVVGCPEPEIPENAELKRTGDKLEMTCADTSETWYLYCNGTTWIGPRRNCTKQSPWGVSKLEEQTTSPFPYGIVTAIIIGIILGILLGLTLLALILMYERRKRRMAGYTDATPASPARVSLPGTISRISCDEHVKPYRTGQYGYAHVWELKQLKDAQDDTVSINTMTTAPQRYHSTKDHVTYCEHAHTLRPWMGEMVESPHVPRNFRLDGIPDVPTYHELDPEVNDPSETLHTALEPVIIDEDVNHIRPSNHYSN